MKTVLTAKDVLKKYYPVAFSEQDTFGFSLEQALLEFAQLHVKAAIRECIESAPSGSSTDTVSYEDVVDALKDCYPETLIK